MATIASIGLKFVVFTEDVFRGVDRIIRKVKSLDTAKRLVSSGWSDIAAGIRQIFGALIGNFPALISALGGGFLNLGRAARAFGQAASASLGLLRLVPIALSLIASAALSVVGWLSKLGSLAVRAGAYIASKLFLPQLWAALAPRLVAVWNRIYFELQAMAGAFVDAWRDVMGGISTVFSAIGGAAVAVFNVASRAAATAFNFVGRVGAAAFNYLRNKAAPVTAWLANEWVSIKSAFVQAYADIAPYAARVYGVLRMGASAIAGVAQQAWAKIASSGRAAWGVITATAMPVWNAISAGFGYVRAAAGGFFSALKPLGNMALGVLGGLAKIGKGIGKIFVGAVGFVLEFVGSLGKIVGVAAGVVGAVIGIGAAIYAFVNHGIEAIMATDRLAFEFGISYNAMRGLENMARRVGVTMQTLEQILRHLAEFQGAVAAGEHNAILTLKLLGMTAKQVLGGTVDTLFFKVIGRLRELKSNTGQAFLAMLVFGRNFTAALKIANNPQAVSPEQMQHAMSHNGQMLSDKELANVEQANVAVSQMKELWDGISTVVTVALAPIITTILQDFLSWINAGDGVKSNMLDITSVAVGVIEAILQGVAFIVAAWDSLFFVIDQGWNIVKLAAGAFYGWILGKIADLLDLASKLPEALGGGGKFKGAADAVRGMADAADKMKNGAADAISGAANPLDRGKKILAHWDEIKKKIAAAIMEQEKAGKDSTANKGRLANIEMLKQLFDKFGQMKDPPLLRGFNDMLDRFDELQKTGQNWLGTGIVPFNDDDAALVKSKMVEDLANKIGENNYHSPQALEANSKEVGSVIAGIFNNKTKYNPQERIRQLMEEAAHRDEEKLRYSREVRDALKNVKKVAI